MMGEHCGERGKSPELECLEHVDATGRVPAPSRELLLQLRRLVRLMYATTYSEATTTDVQRLLRHVLPGAQLVLAEWSASPQEPTYFLTASMREKIAYLLLPGTRNPSDVVTDVNADAEELASGAGHRGMVRSARWLFDEVSPILMHLYTQGFRIAIVGHSLGAGVGALLTVMLRPQIGSLRCYGFGTPACVDEGLMALLLDCMVSVVNRDDVVPRLNVCNVQALVESSLCAGQVAKTKAWMEEDLKALKDVERVVELRRRDAPTPVGDAASKAEKVKRLCEAGVAPDAAEDALEQECWDLTRALIRATNEEVEGRQPPEKEVGQDQSGPPAAQSGASALQALEEGSKRLFGELQRFSVAATAQVSSWSGRPPEPNAPAQVSLGPSSPADQRGSRARLFVPGQVVHLYRRDGLSRAALAPCTHDTLLRICPSPSMIEDHLVKAYDEALQQACIADPRTPRWESFEERQVCACCEADFNWAYVLKSEPQRMLARNNCFSCGRAVCEGCSENRRAHPHLGLFAPVRTCDSCFFRHGSSDEHQGTALSV